MRTDLPICLKLYNLVMNKHKQTRRSILSTCLCLARCPRSYCRTVYLCAYWLQATSTTVWLLLRTIRIISPEEFRRTLIRLRACCSARPRPPLARSVPFFSFSASLATSRGAGRQWAVLVGRGGRRLRAVVPGGLGTRRTSCKMGETRRYANYVQYKLLTTKKQESIK